MSDNCQHVWVPGSPIVMPDGSQKPRLVCIKCPAEQS